MSRLSLLLVLAAAALGSCQTERAGGPLKIESGGARALPVMQRIAEAGRLCWIKSGDRAFRAYHLIPELDTHAGRPRILLVRRDDPRGLPSLVIEAAEKPVTIQTYGPLAVASVSSRINTDISRWATGQTGC